LADRSGGLPLFVRGIVSQLVASRWLARVGGHWVVDSMDGVELPSEVRELVRARLESLSPDQRALVDLVAVAGGAISHSLLTSAAPTDPVPALQRLINGGTIVEDLTGSGVAYRLMHPLVTEVAAGLLPEVGRRRLHARLAAAVRRDHPTQLGLLAHHMTSAGDEVEPTEALVVLRAALKHALDTQAGSAAARHADAALRPARQLDTVEDVPSLLEQRARALDLAGEGSGTLAAWTAASDAWQAAGATRQWGRALVQLSVAEWDRGLFSEAVGHAEEAIRALEAWPTTEEYLGALATWGGYLHRLSSPRLPDAVAALETAAQRTGSPIARLEADVGRAPSRGPSRRTRCARTTSSSRSAHRWA
jgi:hypothetical protein